MSANFDLNSFLTRGSASHDLKYGFQWRRVNATTGTLWPGNGILALQNSPTALFAELFRQGRGTNRASYLDFYAGDTISLNRMTFDLGVRYDRHLRDRNPGVVLGIDGRKLDHLRLNIGCATRQDGENQSPAQTRAGNRETRPAHWAARMPETAPYLQASL